MGTTTELRHYTQKEFARILKEKCGIIKPSKRFMLRFCEEIDMGSKIELKPLIPVEQIVFICNDGNFGTLSEIYWSATLKGNKYILSKVWDIVDKTILKHEPTLGKNSQKAA